ncbi:myoneurin-like isoform X6 [Eurosta solidaginis]|uniref:myoneurin-like isoform X6 n=1 Tax=Eurosta solidaginis TaxID=178769 RepID=UPI0035307A6E
MRKDTRVEQKHYKKRNFWLGESQSLLINLWKSKVDELRGVRKNVRIVQTISKVLQQLGFSFTAHEVKTKMHNLTARYRKEVTQIEESGGIPSDWPFYTEMHELMALLEPPSNNKNRTEENIRVQVNSNELKINAETFDKSKVRCEDLKKCGEIATLLSVGKSEFFLNCGFCEFTFLQLENFTQHMYDDHLSEFPRVEIKQEEYNIENILEGEYDPVPLEDNAEENDDEHVELNAFERIEIELDTAGMGSLVVKQEIEHSFSFEERPQKKMLEKGKEVSTQVSKPNKGTNDSHRKTAETNETHYQTSTHYENDNCDLLAETDIIEETETEDILSKSVYEAEYQTSTHYENDNSDLLAEMDIIEETETEDILSKSVYETEATPNSIIKEMKKVPDTTLDNTQYTILAKTYKPYRCLWDETHIAYRFKNRRDEALESLQEVFNKKCGLNLNTHNLQYEIKNLRKRCSFEKGAKIKCKRHKLIYRPTFKYYNDMEYLEVDVPPFECTICGKLLDCWSHYKEHVASHDGSLPFKCHVCKQEFKLSPNLTVHLRRHAQDYMHSCEVCNKLCITSTEKIIHMRTHTGEKPFVCYVCGYKTTTSSHLLVHIRRHKKQRRHKCTFCSKMFCETNELKEHMMRHRNIRDQICDICHKGFTTLKQLRQHALIHNTEKKYSCRICGKLFAQFPGLSCHMKSHGSRIG